MLEIDQGQAEQLGVLNPKELLTNLGNINGIAVPRNKTEIRILEKELSSASVNNPLEIFAGSCPDYSHSRGLYDHRSLNSGVPLLTTYHIESEIPLLKIFDAFGIPYVYRIALADVEATDSTFAAKFTEGDEEEFLKRCSASVLETKLMLDKIKKEYALSGELSSTSFFELLGRQSFMYYQEKYKKLLASAYEENSKIRARIDGDTAARMQMYLRMYDGVTEGMGFTAKQSFYVSRTIRTMAQYLALGRLISEKSFLPLIISHPTRNMSVFNDRNKFLLPEDNNRRHATLPIMEMCRKVY